MTQEEVNTLKETVISVLKTIYDPEIPIDIWTLHLIYGVDVDEEGNVLNNGMLTQEVAAADSAVMNPTVLWLRPCPPRYKLKCRPSWA